MASNLPPPPYGADYNSQYWRQWFRSLWIKASKAGEILWEQLELTGSDLNELDTKNHNDLDNIDGGTATEYYHLTNAQHSGLTGGGNTSLHTHTYINKEGSTTDNALVRWDGTGGQDVQNSGWTLDDSEVLSAAGKLGMADNIVERPEIKDYAITRTTPSSSSGTLTLNMTNGNTFEVTLTENVTTLTLSNPPASGSYGELIVILKQDGTGGWTFAWGSVLWPGGTAPTVTSTANAVDVYRLFTTDAGSTWYGQTIGQDFS